MIIQPHQIDFSKYNRFFVFGCSFSHHIFPSWCDILMQEMPQAEYYNFAKSGAGNLMIHCRLVEADHRFKFNENDLVAIMWTTFCREDRYKGNDWVHPGNIFTQGTYNHDFVKQWADPRGYLIRDIALINTAYNFLDNLTSDALSLMAVPYEHQQDKKEIEHILQVYKDFIDIMPKSFYELEMGNLAWGIGLEYIKDGEKFVDYHPTTDRHFNYLSKIQIPLTGASMDYTRNVIETLKHNIVEEYDTKRFFKYLPYWKKPGDKILF